MGGHIMLDFHDVHRVDLGNVEKVMSIFEEALKKTDCNVCDRRSRVFGSGEVSLIYLLSESHFSFHAWPAEKCATVDFYNCGLNSRKNCKVIEEALCEAFGWECCSSNIIMNRGSDAKLLTNGGNPQKSDILKGLRAISRTRSQFQDIRVYESENLGRTLVIDGQVQMCSGLVDNYSVSMVENVLIDTEANYEHVLIIGGGDLKIVNYICKNYANVQKITLCEIDPMVIEITECYFPELKLSEENAAKVEIVHFDGQEYLRNSQIRFDAIIVDCADLHSNASSTMTTTTDSQAVSSSPALSLFTNEFYKTVLRSLKPGSSFSQMISIDEANHKFVSMIENNSSDSQVDFVFPETPEYCNSQPIGIVTVPHH